jgi:hypothetical protein
MATIKVKMKDNSAIPAQNLISRLTPTYEENPNFTALFRQEESALAPPYWEPIDPAGG